MASTIIGIRFYRIGHVLHHGIVCYFQIVCIRSLFTVLAGDTYQGNPQKAFQPVQGHSLGTEIAKKASLTREAFFNGHVISLILLSHETSIVYFTITRRVTNKKSNNLLCETTKCLAVSAESWMKRFGVNQKCNLRKEYTFT